MIFHTSNSDDLMLKATHAIHLYPPISIIIHYYSMSVFRVKLLCIIHISGKRANMSQNYVKSVALLACV